MYSAKTFYELAGVKRSTVRHFVEKGLLKPAYIQENGYALYSDSQLLDIVCLKNERSLDFSIQDIELSQKANLPQKIEEIEQRKREYEQKISTLRHKIDTIEMYRRILLEMVDCKEKLRIDDPGHKSYESIWINRSMGRFQKQTVEEIAHCIDAFPFVRIILRGRKEDVSDPEKKAIPMEIGYMYEAEKSTFTPLHPELYETIPASPSVLLRTVTHTPLLLDKEQLRPINEAMAAEGLYLAGDLYTYVHAVENTKLGNRYYVTLRMVVKSNRER